MTDIMAAIGLAQLERYPQLPQRRREIIGIYNEILENSDIQVLNHYTDTSSSSGHLYLTRLLGKDEQQRNAAITRMAERGIATNVHYKPLPMMSAYRNLGFDIANYPNAYNLYSNELTLPLHTLLTDYQARFVAQNLAEICS